MFVKSKLETFETKIKKWLDLQNSRCISSKDNIYSHWPKQLLPGALPAELFSNCVQSECLLNPSPQVPFTTMMALLCMWFGISMPLVYLGYYFGFRKQPYDNPVRTNQIPRQVPEQRWYMNKFVGWVLIRSSNLLSLSYASHWDCLWLQSSIWPFKLMQGVFITYRMFSFH